MYRTEKRRGGRRHQTRIKNHPDASRESCAYREVAFNAFTGAENATGWKTEIRGRASLSMHSHRRGPAQSA